VFSIRKRCRSPFIAHLEMTSHIYWPVAPQAPLGWYGSQVAARVNILVHIGGEVVVAQMEEADPRGIWAPNSSPLRMNLYSRKVNPWNHVSPGQNPSGSSLLAKGSWGERHTWLTRGFVTVGFKMHELPHECFLRSSTPLSILVI
jgi:hypothetical protein